MLILVDSNHLCYKAKYSTGNLSYDEKRTGVIFTFLYQVLRMAEVFNTDRFVFAWDSRESFRRKVYSQYKMQRIERREKKPPEEKKEDLIAYQQFTLLRKYVLSQMGFRNNFMQNGYEADDIIAKCCNDTIDEEILIYSNDHDLYQLLNNKTSMIKSKFKKENDLYRLSDFQKDWQIDSKSWPHVLAIAGCSTDNVEGMPRVGKKTAIKYLFMQKHKKALFGNDPIDHDIFARNLPLVQLPYLGIKSFPLKFGKFKSGNFLDIFKEFGFKSFLTSLWLRWNKAFEL